MVVDEEFELENDFQHLYRAIRAHVAQYGADKKASPIPVGRREMLLAAALRHIATGEVGPKSARRFARQHLYYWEQAANEIGDIDDGSSAAVIETLVGVSK